MAFPEYEKLFLLEVLVDNVYISGSSLNLNPSQKSNLRETCVMFQFLDYPALVVCEEDFFKGSRHSSDTQLNFKSGKSCIFPMSSSVIPALPYKFDVNVTVVRKVDEFGDKLTLGKAVVRLGDSFAALMHSSVDAPDLPLQKTISGTFDLTDETCRKVGCITAFLRLSCFGQLIVTQFQVEENNDAFMFKGTEPKQIVEIPGDYSQVPKFQVDPDYVSTQAAVQEDAGYGDAMDQYTGATDYPCYPTEAYQDPQPPPEPEGNYKEIVAEIRGHSLHIKVPMREKKEHGKRKKGEEAPICKFAPPLNLCDCDFPVPPEAIPRCDV